MNEDTLDLNGGTKRIDWIGEGKPVIVVHGGPGMDYSYMVRGLLPLATECQLVFYEQTPERDASDVHPAAGKQVRELEDVIAAVKRKTGQRVGLVAHSWGTFLVIELMRHNGMGDLDGIALVNPMPLTWDRFVAAGERLMARVDIGDLREVEVLEAKGTESSGCELMSLVSYAYLSGGRASPVRPTFNRYNPTVNAAVLASVEGYDQTNIRSCVVEGNFVVVYGDDDYLTPQDSIELHDIARRVDLHECGHLPFDEQPEGLRLALRASVIWA